jgi:hypothetical protein
MRNLIISTSMCALLAVAGTAVAQTTKGDGGTGASPSQPSSRDGPASSSPSSTSEREGRQSPGTSTRENPSGPSDRKAQESPANQKGAQKGTGEAEKSGDAKRPTQRDAKENQRANDDAKDQKPSSNADRREEGKDTNRAGAKSDPSKGSQASNPRSESSSDTPRSDVTINVTPEKKREVTTVFAKYRGKAVANVNVRATVGVAVPRTVTLVEVPQDIVVIVPEYKRYKYFITDDVVCIVDPETYVIVDVIRLT